MIKNCVQIISIVFITLIYSCNNKLNIVSKKNTETNGDAIVKRDSINLPPYIPSLISYKQSECISNCENIFYLKLSHDTLFLKFAIVLECGAKYTIETQYQKEGTLNIIAKNKSGIIEDCYCLYVFEMKIKHIPAMPEKLMVNGELFDKSTQIFNNELYTLTQESPAFPGGDEAFHNFINQHLVYPDSSYKAKVEGTVYLKCGFNEFGKIIECTILRGINQELNDEACRLVSKMPNWIIKENTSSFIYLPIKFKIRE